MKIIIADDHEIVRHGLQQIISKHHGWSVTAVASERDLITSLRRERYDVIILDVALSERTGIELLPSLRAEFPSIPVLMLSMYDEMQYAVLCLRAGAAGYVQKDRSAEQILTAIDRVAAGRRYLSEAVAEQLAAQAITGERPPHERLSEREFQVFRRLALGQSVSEIAQAMHLSVKTVSTFRSRALAKMNLRTTSDIVRYAVQHSLV